MKLIFAVDHKGHRRILLEVNHDTAEQIRDYWGGLPPWVILDGQPVDDKVILRAEEDETPT